MTILFVSILHALEAGILGLTVGCDLKCKAEKDGPECDTCCKNQKTALGGNFSSGYCLGVCWCNILL